MVTQIVYAILATVFGSVATSFMLVACFCYMVKCIPRNSDNGLLVAVFITAYVLGCNLSRALDPFTTMADVLIIISVGVLCFLALIIFKDALLPVPNFALREIDINRVNLCMNEERPDPMICQVGSQKVDEAPSQSLALPFQDSDGDVSGGDVESPQGPESQFG